MIGVAASGSAVGKLNICAQQHYCCWFFLMFGAVLDGRQCRNILIT